MIGISKLAFVEVWTPNGANWKPIAEVQPGEWVNLEIGGHPPKLAEIKAIHPWSVSTDLREPTFLFNGVALHHPVLFGATFTYTTRIHLERVVLGGNAGSTITMAFPGEQLIVVQLAPTPPTMLPFVKIQLQGQPIEFVATVTPLEQIAENHSLWCNTSLSKQEFPEWCRFVESIHQVDMCL